MCLWYIEILRETSLCFKHKSARDWKLESLWAFGSLVLESSSFNVKQAFTKAHKGSKSAIGNWYQISQSEDYQLQLRTDKRDGCADSKFQRSSRPPSNFFVALFWIIGSLLRTFCNFFLRHSLIEDYESEKLRSLHVKLFWIAIHRHEHILICSNFAGVVWGPLEGNIFR